MGEFIKAGEGDFFVQTERSEPFEHLSCVGVGDLPLPLGDLTPVYCPDPASKGKFQIDGFVQGEPGSGTTTLTRPFSAVANWLLENDCGFEALVTYACRGARAIPENYEVAAVLFGAQPTTPTLASAVASTPGDDGRVETNVDISYIDRKLVYHLQVAAQSLTNTADANAIAFLPKACESRCGAARNLCAYGYMALDGTQYNSEIKYTKNGGATWAQTAADPFLYDGGDASDLVVFETADGHTVMVSRGSTAIGEPAEIAYSAGTDTVAAGATWTNVYVGAANGQTIQALYMYGGRIWAAVSGGYIYVTKDLGASWTASESGVETVQDLNDISMYSLNVGYAVGNSNAFLYTTDGSEWNSRTGPVPGTNLLSVTCNDKGYVCVGAADGNLYVSEDSGATWTTRLTLGAGSIDWLSFDESRHYFGGLVYTTAAGVGTFYRTKDGGATWQASLNQPANSGLNGGFVCDQNNFFTVGLAHGGNTFVARVSPSS